MPISRNPFLQERSRTPDPTIAAVADNCRFDERASLSRWQQFEELLTLVTGGRRSIEWPDWTEANQENLERYCNVPSTAIPDAFLDINRSAWLDAPTDHQEIVRIESLTRPLKATGLDLPAFEALLLRSDSRRDPDARQAVDLFFETWNQLRDGRPAFGAFLDEVVNETQPPDWPHELRDRLGLGHYPSGGQLPVALMKYKLSDVLAVRGKRSLAVACALPTVLDGGMHEFFFPVPREHPFGATVHLSPGKAEILTAEIVHCRIDYKREYLLYLGYIERAHSVRGDALLEARDLHLLSIRLACERHDFGEDMKGRT